MRRRASTCSTSTDYSNRRATDLVDFQKPYAHKHAPTRDFVAAIESIKPTTIIGVSTIGGAFTQKVD